MSLGNTQNQYLSIFLVTDHSKLKNENKKHAKLKPGNILFTFPGKKQLIFGIRQQQSPRQTW